MFVWELTKMYNIKFIKIGLFVFFGVKLGDI